MTSAPRTGLEQRLLARLKALDTSGSTQIALAFSGGNDSLALALGLSRCAPLVDRDVALIHIDHRLRPESKDDVRRCQILAATLGLPVHIATLETGMATRASGIGVEERARRERYLAISEICRANGITTIATAHHAEDQAETVLMHLFRGSALAGAGGMQEAGWKNIPWWENSTVPGTESRFRIFRPFLYERKATLEQFVSDAGLVPVSDDSNANISFRRNAVRHSILPIVGTHYPAVVDALGRFSDAAREDDELLTQQANHLLDAACNEFGGLDIGQLILAPRPLATRAVRAWIVNAGVEEPSRNRVLACLSPAQSDREDQLIEVGNGQCVLRVGDRFAHRLQR